MKVKQFFRKHFALIIAGAILAAPLSAAIGDNPPPIPSTYNTGHPRLPVPDNAWLTALANNPTALARYNAAADAWDSTNPDNSMFARRLIIAYMANKITNPTKAATYLAKIKAMANLGGLWGKLMLSANDGVGNGTRTITSASANFLTGCGGASCKGYLFSVLGRTQNVVSVVDAHTITVDTNQAVLTGTNIPIRIFGSEGDAGIGIALIYDWLYNDLDTATKTEFLKELDSLCSIWQENYIGLGASPYNDVMYIRLSVAGFIDALALYPDHPNGLGHLNFMSDVWFNRLLPAWKQVFGPEGGGWHESWPDYLNSPSGGGMNTYIVPSLLSWQAATGDPIFTRESWLKNYAYQTMYSTRPDFIIDKYGDTSRPYMTEEYSIGIGAGLGSLNGLAEIYNDPVLRGWARVVNHELANGPDGFEPSAWPFYKPDNKNNASLTRAALPGVRNFPGWGMVNMRTGWTEDDTAVSFKYGDNFWSHEHFDVGAFTIFNRGNLALDAGTYRAGSASPHQDQYGRQTIAHNTLTITDPADVYPSTQLNAIDQNGNTVKLTMANDGGQRRLGSGYNAFFSQLDSLDLIGDWLTNWDYYHTGKMVAFANTPAYTYTAVDITAAYNNKFSVGTPNATNRTYRVQQAVRHMLFVPRGTAAYVVVFDQVNSTNPAFAKKWLLHTVNQPVVNGSAFTVTRSELVTELPYNWTKAMSSQLKHCPGNDCTTGNQYQYAGKLYGWMVQPQAGTINLVGGPGKEFWIEDPLHPGTGTNWNQCTQGQCAATVEGLGPVDDLMSPDPMTAPHDVGSWRIEETPAVPAAQDYFLNVMLATTVTDTHVPPTVTAPAGLAAGLAGATWVESGTTYTITLPKSGVGGHITISGVVDEDLLSHAQPLPDSMQVVSGTPQVAQAGAVVPGALTVVAKDSAGNPIANQIVHYGITTGAGLLSSATAITNSQGQASVNLTMGAGAVGSLTKVMADINGIAPVEFNITVSGGGSSPLLSTLACTPSGLSSGLTSTCTVTLTQAATTSAVTVGLSSSSLLVSVPASVVIPVSATSATFSATAGTIASVLNVTITATLTGATRTSTINLMTSGPVGGTSLPANNWVMAPTHGFPVQAVGYENLIYAPSPVKKAVMLGNYHDLGSEPNQSLNAYDFETNRWSVLNIGANFHTETMPEAGHPVGGLSYDPNEQTFLLYCCGSGSNQPENVFYTWWFDPLGQSGRNKQTSPKPGAVLQIGSGFDTVNHTWVIIGNGTWTYSPTANTYHQQTSAGTAPPNGINLPDGAYNTADHKVYFFGGQVGAGYTNALYAYDVPSNTWALLTPSGTLPAPRWRGGFAYDSTNNVFLLFGGQDATTVYNDTWIYNPTANSWTKLTPGNPPPVASGPTFDRLAYDSDHNAFILVVGATGGYADGAGSGYAIQTWLYRYAGSGPSVGAANTTYQPTGGAINLNSDAWAKDPSIAGSGTKLYAAWVETGKTFDTTTNAYFHTYGIQRSAGTWSALGGTPTSIDSEFNGNSESHFSAISVVAGTPWISWFKWNNTGNTNTGFALWAKSWNGSAWVGGVVGPGGTNTTKVYQSRSQITDVGGVPYVAFLEVDKNFFPQKTFVYVKAWNGTAWVSKGGALNISTANTTAGSVSITSDGTTPYVAWSEYTSDAGMQNQTPSQIYVSRWTGSAWAAVGGSLNLNPSNWADDATIAYVSGQPYVAWTERTTAGNNQVYVKTFSGSWAQVGTGTLNRDTTNGWAYRPSLVADPAATALYLGWVEQQAIGQRAQTYVSKYASGAWTQMGGSLNADTVAGSSERVSMAVVGGQPAAAWGEVNYGSLRQIYVKQWSGSAWTLAPGNPLPPTTPNPPPPPPPPPTGTTCDLNGDGVVNILDVQMAVSQALGVTVCTTSDLQTNGTCNVVDVQRIINAALGAACVIGP